MSNGTQSVEKRSKSLTSEQWQLVVDAHDLIYSVLSSYPSWMWGGEDFGVLVSDCAMPIVERCARSFDSSRGQFTTLVVTSLRRELPSTLINRLNKRNREVTIPHTPEEADDALLCGATETSPAELVIEAESARQCGEMIIGLLGSLTEREGYIIRRLFLSQEEVVTLTQVAVELKISGERVRQLRDQALSAMRLRAPVEYFA